MMKSKIINRKEIDKQKTIVIDDVQVDHQNIEQHRQRINTIFANQTEEYRLEQLNKMIIHDIIFSKAMDELFKHYEFDLNQDDIKEYENFIINTSSNIDKNKELTNQEKEMINLSAKKLLIQKLIFDEIKDQYKIEVTNEELENVLMNYYKQTNQPIRSFKQDERRYEEARISIMNEKIITTIISLFKFDLDKFFEKVKKFNDKLNTNNNQ